MTAKIGPIAIGFLTMAVFGGLAIRCWRQRDSEGMIASAFLAIASVFGAIAALI